MGIHARLIGHQTDAAAAHDRQAVAEQDVDPRPHRAGHRRLGHGAARAAAQRPSAESQHDESSVHSKHLALVVILVAACGPAPATVAPIPTSRAVGPETDVATLLTGMSVRDKIAQLVMPWMPGTYAAYDDEGFARAAAWVDSLHVGGIIVSVGSPLDVAARLNRLQVRSALPLLVGSDFEGGTSLRLNGGTLFPPNMGVGATGATSAHIGGKQGPAVEPQAGPAFEVGCDERGELPSAAAARLSLAATSSGEPTETSDAAHVEANRPFFRRGRSRRRRRRRRSPGSTASPAGRSGRGQPRTRQSPRSRHQPPGPSVPATGIHAGDTRAPRTASAQQDHSDQCEVRGVHRSLVVLGLFGGRSAAADARPRGPDARAPCRPSRDASVIRQPRSCAGAGLGS